MKIPGYFINLDRATARAEHMHAEAARLDLPILREAAVDGTALTDDQIAELHSPVDGMHRLSGPEVGCFLSHRSVWKRIADGPTDFGAVFEDDVTFADDTRTLLNDDSWLPSGAHIIKIETTARKALLLPPFEQVPHDRCLGQLASMHMGGGGYILSQETAVQLVAATQRFGAPVDYLLFSPEHMIFSQIPRWQLFPAICVQQVRSKLSFLPDGAEASGLDAARVSLKLKGWPKFKREITRPFTLGAKEFSARHAACKSGGKWLSIEYRA